LRADGQTNPGGTFFYLFVARALKRRLGISPHSNIISRYLSPLQADPSKPVMVPGDPERNHMKMVDQEGGVRYHENQLKDSVSHSKQTRIELELLRNASCK
jgi:hypothetical protein